jgi:NCS1 family nucleobase:cation symporter-1
LHPFSPKKRNAPLTGLIVGPVAGALHGADLSFYVGFLVAALVYSALSRFGALREAGRAA